MFSIFICIRLFYIKYLYKIYYRIMIGYIFYSKKCKSCYNLMTIMENQKLLNMFSPKCIDDMSDVEITKLGLQSVPTLVLVSNQNGQQKRGIYEKENAFKWVESVIINRRQNMIKYAENTRKLIQINEMKKRFKEGLFEYCQNESEGLSDSYAYWKDNLNQDIDSAQPKTFLPFGHDEKYNIMTIPENKNAKNFKLSNVDQPKLIQNLEKSRTDQDNQIKILMEQQQINSVINADKNNYG